MTPTDRAWLKRRAQIDQDWCSVTEHFLERPDGFTFARTLLAKIADEAPDKAFSAHEKTICRQLAVLGMIEVLSRLYEQTGEDPVPDP